MCLCDSLLNGCVWTCLCMMVYQLVYGCCDACVWTCLCVIVFTDWFMVAVFVCDSVYWLVYIWCVADPDWVQCWREDHRWLPAASVCYRLHQEAQQPGQENLLRPARSGQSVWKSVIVLHDCVINKGMDSLCMVWCNQEMASLCGYGNQGIVSLCVVL